MHAEVAACTENLRWTEALLVDAVLRIINWLAFGSHNKAEPGVRVRIVKLYRSACKRVHIARMLDTTSCELNNAARIGGRLRSVRLFVLIISGR